MGGRRPYLVSATLLLGRWLGITSAKAGSTSYLDVCSIGTYRAPYPPWKESCPGFRECPPGYTCSGGNRTVCPGGTYSPGSDATCAPCSAGEVKPLPRPGPSLRPPQLFTTMPTLAHPSPGYYCPVGSWTSNQNDCGDPSVYCPEGSAFPTNVSMGYYTTTGGLRNRASQSICPLGYFCEHGLSQPCPSGEGAHGDCTPTPPCYASQALGEFQHICLSEESRGSPIRVP